MTNSFKINKIHSCVIPVLEKTEKKIGVFVTLIF